PCSAFTLRVSASRITDTRLSFTVALMSRGSFQFSLPLGPSTDTAPSLSMLTLTLSGISISLFPIRDIKFTKRRPAVRRQLFAFSPRAPIKHRARWKESPRPFRQALAGFYRARPRERSIGPKFPAYSCRAHRNSVETRRENRECAGALL